MYRHIRRSQKAAFNLTDSSPVERRALSRGGYSKKRISLVIPAYNEEHYLRACLGSAIAQTHPFFEIIVVDNNSSDSTAQIARSYKNVRLVHEKKQGVVFARNSGFDAAKGEIIARIDADTILPPNWSESVLREFRDPELAATSGRPIFYDVAWKKLVTVIENWFRRRMANQLRRVMFLQGANMAISKEAWIGIKPHVCNKHYMHEDFDLAIHLQEHGHKVTFTENITAHLSARRVDMKVWHFWKYVGMHPHTYAVHDVKTGRRMYPVIFFLALSWFPVKVLYRGYDVATRSFSFVRVFKRRKNLERPDPTRV